MRTFISSKIHGIRVTDKSVDYHGSVAIDGDLLREAGIEHYEQVAVVNLTVRSQRRRLPELPVV